MNSHSLASSPSIYNKMETALGLLENSDFSPFFEEMISLGGDIQKTFKVDKYKENKATVANIITALKGRPTLNAKQNIAMRAAGIVWNDADLNRLDKVNPYAKYDCYANLAVATLGGLKDAIHISANPSNSPQATLHLIKNGAVIKEVALELTANQTSLFTKNVGRIDKNLKTQESPTSPEIDHLTEINSLIEKVAQDERHLAAKFHLSRDERHKIKLALILLEGYVSKARLTNRAAATDDISVLVNEAHTVLANRQTPAQAAISVGGRFLAFMTAFAFGIVETGTAILALFYASAITWSLSSIPIVLFAGVVSGAATWVNWNNFKEDVPATLQLFFGKDSWFDGLTTYNDKGVKQTLSMRKIAILALLSFAALVTGIAIGALGYTSTLQVAELLKITGPKALAAFGYAGSALGAMVAVTMTAWLVTGFAALLKNNDSTAAFMKPFKEVQDMLNDLDKTQGYSMTRRIVAYSIMAALSVIALAGLAVSAYSCTQSVSKFCLDQFKASPERALAAGIAIGGIGASAARFYKTFSSAVLAGVNASKKIFLSKDDKKLPPKLSWSAIAAVLFESGTAGSFFAQSWIGKGFSGIVAFSAGLLASGRSFVIDMAHLDHSNPNKAIIDRATNARVSAMYKVERIDTQPLSPIEERAAVMASSSAELQLISKSRHSLFTSQARSTRVASIANAYSVYNAAETATVRPRKK
jgi:hypothetical protein